MFEDRFLEITQEELQRLQEENDELKCKISEYEDFIKDLEEILEKERLRNEKRTV